MFHPHAGTREAKAVFADVRARAALQTLIAGSAPDEVVLDVAANHLHVTLSLTGLREFRHYFWNTAPMTRRELAKFIRTFLDDEEMARIASLPPGPSTVARAMFVLGMPPAKIDPEESLRDMFATTGLMFDEYARELPPGPGRSIAMKHMVDAALDLREVLAEIAPEQNNLADEVVQFLAATTDRPNPSLAELREGTPPIPVASLLPAVDAGDDDAPTCTWRGRTSGGSPPPVSTGAATRRSTRSGRRAWSSQGAGASDSPSATTEPCRAAWRR